MFTQVSMAGTGTLITLFVMVFNLLGIEVLETDIQKALEGFVAILGLVYLIVGQIRRKDLSYGFFRK